MKTITKEDFDKIYQRPRNANFEIMSAIKALELHQALIIEPSDWKIKTPPNIAVYQSFRQTRTNKKMSVKTLSGKNGWAVLRTK